MSDEEFAELLEALSDDRLVPVIRYGQNDTRAPKEGG